MHWLPLTFGALVVLCCLPAFVRLLIPPLPPKQDDSEPNAVLVLGGGRVSRKGKMQLSTRSLLRLEAALQLAHDKQLPLLISGGRAYSESGTTEAALMGQLAIERYPDMTIWQEEASSNTWENCRYSGRLLHHQGVNHVYLVTDQVHLCRSLLSLQRQNICVVPRPHDKLPQPEWIPHAGALALWPELMYEWLAIGWYALRYWH